MGLDAALDSDLVYERLLDYGFFPEKLELLLTSKDFGEWVRSEDYDNYKHKSFSSIIFKLTRNNNAPRLLNILHPIGYIHLCKEIRDDWDLIRTIIDDVPDYEKISMIVPKSDNKSGRLTSMDPYDSEIDRLVSLKACNKNEEEKKIAIDKQLGKKYYVFADIASCFPTIYSHAIPWACVGHTEAKRTDKDDTLWYNKLDRKNRKTQRNETIGIAIGPDTSNIITELILSQIDQELSIYNYTRYIDDYKCYCSTKEEADQFLRDLAGLLEKYHLRLNSKKTKILQLPQPLEEVWVRRIREFYNSELQYENEIKKEHIQLISDFLDLTIDLANRFPYESSIKYAIRILANKKYIDYESFSFVLSYISRICFLFPYFIDVIYDLLENNKEYINDNITEQLELEINTILNEHIKNNLSDVIVWCIKIAIDYNLTIDEFDNLSDIAIYNRDCLPLLYCFLYSEDYELDVKKYLDFIETIIDEKIEDEWWLYIYEIFRLYPTKPALKNISYKDFYIELKDNGISFLK